MEHKQWRDASVMSDFLNVVDKIGILLETRARVEKGELKVEPGAAYPKAADVVEFSRAVVEEHVMYRTQQGIYARPGALESRRTIPGHQWFAQYGATTPHLQDVAMKVLGHVASATAIERINSEFSYIHDKKRNRLAHNES